jgi:hypothetical protein
MLCLDLRTLSERERNLTIYPCAAYQKKVRQPKFLDEVAAQIRSQRAELVVIDPLWRVLESELVTEKLRVMFDSFSELTRLTHASLAYAQHQTKGDQSQKDPQDRFSGKNDLARDAATIMTLVEFEVPNDGEEYLQVESRTNDWKRPEPFTIKLNYPFFEKLTETEAQELLHKQGKSYESEPEEILELIPRGADSELFDPTQKDYITQAELIHQAKAKKGWGRDKTVRFLEITKHRKLVFTWLLEKEAGIRGARPKAYSQSKQRQN